MKVKRSVVLALVIALLSAGLLLACHEHEKTTRTSTVRKTLTVTSQTHTDTLYFSGIIRPIQIINVPSPVNGTISKLYFRYGQKINKGQRLVLIRSPKLQDDYQTALTKYLTAKSVYGNAKIKWHGTEELYQAGLVAKNDYDSEKSSLAGDYLSLKQAQESLNQILNNTQGRTLTIQQLEQLDLNQLGAVEKALGAKLDSIPIVSPAYGVVLMPGKGQDSNETGNSSNSDKQIKLGSEVKQNQAIVRIGDFRGIRLHVDVNEIDIANIKIGQKVLITGVAFPDITLVGYVKNIDTQAVSSQTAGLPVFPIEIAVDKLTKAERQLIHLGMSAKVRLLIEQPASISIPLTAIKQIAGKATVQKLDKKTQQYKTVTIDTGKTSQNSVVVTHGLHAGDTILVTHQA